MASSTTISESGYYHQYQLTFQYSTSDSSAIPAANLTNAATFTSFGGAASATPATSSGPTGWADAASAVTYTSPLYGAAG